MAKYSPEIVEKITALMSENDFTIEDICKQVGINQDTYHTWKKEKPEFVDQVKKAEEQRLSTFRKEARIGLSKLLTGYEYEEVTTEYIEGKPDDNGQTKPKMKSQKKIKKFIMPNPTAVIFTLKNLDSENFSEIIKQEITGKNGQPFNDGPETVINYEKLSFKSLEELLEYSKLYPGQKLDTSRVSEETLEDIQRATELHIKGDGVKLILPSNGH